MSIDVKNVRNFPQDEEIQYLLFNIDQNFQESFANDTLTQ